MSAVSIECQIDNVVLDPLLQLLFLFRHVNHFDKALHRVSALFVARYFKDVRPKDIQDLMPLC
jgi:hypothetical protein